MAKAAATARPRRSKADVQQEFLKIRDEVAATREGRNAKMEEAATLREAEIRRTVDGISVEGVAQSISALSVQISKALAEVSDNLIAEVQRLATVREAVTLERAELDRLHKIDVAATALDELVRVCLANIPRVAGRRALHRPEGRQFRHGESLAYVRDQMSLRSIQVTVDLYGHRVPGGNRAAVDRLDDRHSTSPKRHQMRRRTRAAPT